MKIKTGLIVLILFLLVQTYPGLIFSAHAWTQHNSKEGICGQLDPKLSAQGLRYSVNMPPFQNRFFLPPLPVSSSMLFNIEMVPDDRSALVALRYGTATRSYPSDPEKVTFTHSNADYRNFTRLTDIQDGDVVTRYDSRWSSTINVLNFSNAASLTNAAGDYLYVNLFGNRQRILNIVFFIIVNVPEAQKWCQQGNLPTTPQVTPASGTRWLSSPQQIEVRSTFASKIYYLKTESSNPNTPAPDITSAPSPENNTGVLEGTRGTLSLKAEASEYRQFKFRFTGSNDSGTTPSPVYTYTIDRQPVKIGNIVVLPDSGTVEERTTITLNVTSEHSSRIYYTQTESPGQDPGDPKTSTKYISGPNGTLTLSTTAGVEKTFRLKFVGYNDNNPEGEKFGEPSNTLTYTLKGTVKTPGAVSANPPSGTFTTSQTISVSCTDATSIHYTFTTDGKTPDDPKTAVPARRISGNQGTVQLPGQDGRRITVNLGFRGYNETGGEWGPLATFTYTLDLSSLPPIDKEACEAKGWIWKQTFPVAPGECVPPEENPETGSISIEIQPSEAVATGAQWKITTEAPWRNSGEKAADLAPGSHTIEFKPVDGWIKPDNVAITVNAGDNVIRTATYRNENPETGSISIEIQPGEAIAAGAQWKITTEAHWRNSGEKADLPPETYTIEFKPVDGWTKPGNVAITLRAGDTESLTGTYRREEPETGSISIIIEPDGAITAGAQWKIANEVLWRNSAEKADLNPGTHIIEFKPVDGWIKPDNVTVILKAGDNTSLTGTYRRAEPETGSISIEIQPSEAIRAGAQWKIATEEIWRNSGEEATGLKPETYDIEFKPVDGWIKPEKVAVILKAGDNASLTGTYRYAEPETGSIAVDIQPSEAIAAGAQWKMTTEEFWRDSGEEATGLTPGTHTIEFRELNYEVEGLFKPNNINITVKPGVLSRAEVFYDCYADCIQVDEALTLTVPCVNVFGERYALRFNYFNEYTWELDGDSIIETEAQKCQYVDEDLNLNVTCVDVAGDRYGFMMMYDSDLFWRLDEHTFDIMAPRECARIVD